MEIPINLKHKPVFLCPDYDEVDGREAGNSETKGLSLGLAQWNDRGSVDISAKVWRKSGERWSRQSEELPIHRVLDLALLITEAKAFLADSYRFPKLYDEKNPLIARIGLQGSAMTVEVCDQNPMLDTDIRLFAEALSRDDELISERMSCLADLLNDAGYGKNAGK
mgnify:CR=1 FL=1